MNVEDAIKILKERGDITDIEKIGKNKYKCRLKYGVDPEFQYIEQTARELIKRAKIYTHDNRQTTAVKKLVKRYDKSKNRSSTRDVIQTEEFDKIPQQGKVKSDDIWSWD